MKVYKVHYNGSWFCVPLISDAVSIIQEEEFNSRDQEDFEIKLERVEMDEEEFQNLPEFEGW